MQRSKHVTICLQSLLRRVVQEPPKHVTAFIAIQWYVTACDDVAQEPPKHPLYDDGDLYFYSMTDALVAEDLQVRYMSGDQHAGNARRG